MSRPLPPALLDVVVEVANDAVIAVDADARVVTWGRVAGRYFGYTADEIVDAPVLTLVAETMHPDVAAVIERMLAGELVRRYETVGQRKDGMPLPISLSGCAVAVAGSAISAVLVLRDLTEQRLAQAALAEVEARLRESEALAGVGSWLWDVGSGVVQWSDEAHRLHGIDPLAFDGTLAWHLRAIHRDDRDRVRAAMESAVSSRRPFDEEYRIERPDGIVRTIHARAQPTPAAAARALGLRGVMQDVTERQPARTA